MLDTASVLGVIERAAWTFVQAFLAVFVTTQFVLSTIAEQPTDGSAFKAAVVAAALSGVAALTRQVLDWHPSTVGLDVLQRFALTGFVTFLGVFLTGDVFTGFLGGSFPDSTAWVAALTAAVLSAFKATIASQFGIGTGATLPATDEIPLAPAIHYPTQDA